MATWSKNCNFPKHLGMLLFASLAWALWTTRNKMAIEHIFPNNAIQTFHVFVGFMQRWSPLSKASDREKVRDLVELLKAWAMGFRPSMTSVSDIEFL